MLHRIVFIAALLPALAACSDDAPEVAITPTPQLQLACQTVECFCIDDSGGIFTASKKADVVWKDNGDASCPAGYRLKRVETDFLGRKS